MITSQTLSFMATPLPNSPFLGRSPLLHRPTFHQPPSSRLQFKTSAKFDLSTLLGGRGLCNGEIGVEKELQKKTISTDDKSEEASQAMASVTETATEKETETVSEDGFDKEMMGLTGGFPGGEKGLRLFIEKNPPPSKKEKPSPTSTAVSSKPKPPELPILMPGMIAIVKNQNHPFYMYCGIVQRITDGKAGVLFEGGNWDRLITFRLEELERREKGPPMKNPKSAIFEKLLLENEEAAS